MNNPITEETGIRIALVFDDLTTKVATVTKLTDVISWKGKYFRQMQEISFTYYKQVPGEDLSNIEV